MAETTKNLITKLAEIMAEVGPVNKRGQNVSQNYSYVKATDLANAVRKKLSAKGVFMTADVVDVRHTEFTTAKGAFMRSVDMKVLYTFHDGSSGEKVSFHGYGSGMDSGDKAVYKAHTGALKYALRNAFLVPDEQGDPEYDRADRERAGTVGKPLHKFPLTGVIAEIKPKDKHLFLKVKNDMGMVICTTDDETVSSRLLDAEGETINFLVEDTLKVSKGLPVLTILSIEPSNAEVAHAEREVTQ